MWIGREDEIGQLGGVLEGTGPTLALIRGPAGIGRSALARRALPSDRHVGWYQATPLGATLQHDMLARAWREGADPAPSDRDLLPRALLEDRRPTVLVLDGAEHLADPGSASATIAATWSAARAQALPLHLVLLGTRAGLDVLVPPGSPLAEAAALDLELGPLAAYDLADALSEWTPHERLVAWAVFGGFPARVRHLDPSVRLATNIQRLVLAPDGPLHGAGADLLARRFQKPERYAGLVRALSMGARDWGGLRAAVPEFTASSQLAPYLASLEEHGLVRPERPLDARPGSRTRRYRLTDPFVGFWHRCVLPRLGLLAYRDPRAVWREGVEDDVEAWAETVFPFACRDFLLARGDRVFPARAREVGGLWGDGYDVPLAATLRNGAVLYGASVDRRPARLDDARSLEQSVRGTRYGFGREARVRVVFAAQGVDRALRREAARDPLLEVVTWSDMVGA